MVFLFLLCFNSQTDKCNVFKQLGIGQNTWLQLTILNVYLQRFFGSWTWRFGGGEKYPNQSALFHSQQRSIKSGLPQSGQYQPQQLVSLSKRSINSLFNIRSINAGWGGVSKDCSWKIVIKIHYSPTNINALFWCRLPINGINSSSKKRYVKSYILNIAYFIKSLLSIIRCAVCCY